MFLHQKIIGNSSDTRLLERTSNDCTLRPTATAQQLHRAGGVGVAAAAVSPSGKQIALACRDGTLRVLEIPSGTLIAGFKSYYGGLLCCSWSQDGKLIASGGEDDLVAVYNFQNKSLVAHLQGHTSWVSGVAFDPWALSVDTQTSSPSASSSSTTIDGGSSGGYRLASVGQDCQGILWEIGSGLLESSSNSGSGGSRSDGMDIDRGVGANGGSTNNTGSSTHVIAPALPRAEMTFLDPIAQLKMHIEPLCDVVFEPHAMLVSSNDGSVKKFVRESATQAAAPP